MEDAKFRLAHFVGQFFCSHNRHKWREETKIYKEDRRLFYTRTCLRPECGLFQIQMAGPMGDNSWKSPDEAFLGEAVQWEREQYSKAVPYEVPCVDAKK